MPLIKFLLFPFAFLYGLVTDYRNHLYDIGKKPGFKFDRFIISVGNLTAGGTGKTPFVEMLVRALCNHFELAVLSRGYRRKTTGYRLAGSDDNALTIGDEPFQYFLKYGNVLKVAVGEERILAIPELLSAHESVEVIILDDAYQHRKVQRDYNVLLCDYHRPFYNDKVIPAGLLREKPRHANRADVVVVTKCPDGMESKEMQDIQTQIIKYTKSETPIYFSGIRYLEPKGVYGEKTISASVFLFTGIASHEPLEKYTATKYNLIGSRHFPDHHHFSRRDMDLLLEDFNKCPGADRCLLTTEKDMVRLLSLDDARLKELPIFYLPIELYFIEKGDFFTSGLIERINNSKSTLGQEEVS
ncbi:MAG: tetraacyldisaccharide 4'-kinase [Cyclobacteriaceae bacterium]|nr:tetraacyldisaccharide 4'-kinase [Cyclobacteriaceae bacterium]